MAQFMVLHKYKASPEGFWQYFGAEALQLARAMADGQTPARCLKSWSPYLHGCNDLLFCLWEAERPEDILATLSGASEYLTSDILEVDEINWEELHQAALAPA
jgi:hypothetical protein